MLQHPADERIAVSVCMTTDSAVTAVTPNARGQRPGQQREPAVRSTAMLADAGAPRADSAELVLLEELRRRAQWSVAGVHHLVFPLP
jgi:hypothetical protein